MIAEVEGERFTLGAWDGDRLVGTAGLVREGDTDGFVWAVYVAPTVRGRGAPGRL